MRLLRRWPRVETSGRKRGRVSEYVCHRHRANGTCTNDLRLPVDDLNDAVLREIEAHALTPEAVEPVIALSERDDVQERQAALRQERTDIEQRLARLVSAIETGGDVSALTHRIRDLEIAQPGDRSGAGHRPPGAALADEDDRDPIGGVAAVDTVEYRRRPARSFSGSYADASSSLPYRTVSPIRSTRRRGTTSCLAGSWCPAPCVRTRPGRWARTAPRQRISPGRINLYADCGLRRTSWNRRHSGLRIA